MCSQADDPTQYDAPEPTRPRTYVLSAEKRPEEPRPSVALAVLGEMLDEAESCGDFFIDEWQVPILLEARDRIAKAEAEA